MKQTSQIAPTAPGVHFTDAVLPPPAGAVKVKHVSPVDGSVICWAWVAKEYADAEMMATAMEFYEQHCEPNRDSVSRPALTVMK